MNLFITTKIRKNINNEVNIKVVNLFPKEKKPENVPAKELVVSVKIPKTVLKDLIGSFRSLSTNQLGTPEASK